VLTSERASERARARSRSRAPIYNKMKAIRGDNPRTTNQRVYLMPVVPPPSPEKPPTWNNFPSLSLSLSILLYIDASLLYLYLLFSPARFLSPSSPRFSLSFPLILSVYHASSLSSPFYTTYPYALTPTSSRCCSRICHYATDITNPPLSSLSLYTPLLLTHSLVRSSSSLHFPAALFATCRTLAHPRDLAQSVLLY